MNDCPNQKKNCAICNCSYDPCSRKGICCECIQYHRRHDQLPACFFPPDIEKTYDRSVKKFVETQRKA